MHFKSVKKKSSTCIENQWYPSTLLQWSLATSSSCKENSMLPPHMLWQIAFFCVEMHATCILPQNMYYHQVWLTLLEWAWSWVKERSSSCRAEGTSQTHTGWSAEQSAGLWNNAPSSAALCGCSEWVDTTSWEQRLRLVS